MTIGGTHWVPDPDFPFSAEPTYLPAIRAAHADPQQLEQLYQGARREKAGERFVADLLVCYREAPDNLLYAAWYYRLHQSDQQEASARLASHWRLAIPLSLLNGLLLWLLSDNGLVLGNRTPYVVLLWSPLAALLTLAFLALTLRAHYRRFALIGAGLAALSTYILLMTTVWDFAVQVAYIDLMLAHTPLLAWGAVGLGVLGLDSSPRQRFGFLLKSVEVIGSGGVYALAVALFAIITQGMFAALNVPIPDLLIRLLWAGGIGSIPLLAIASVYDPHLSPLAQEFRRGLGKIIATLMWLLLPLTLTVLAVYLVFIPFNFMRPFNERDALVVYNVMLFAIMGLLVGATPITSGELPARYRSVLRAALLAVAGLAALVSVYALAAIVYRTLEDAMTVNRLAIIVWNSINIGILSVALFTLARNGRDAWVEALQGVFGRAVAWYLAWAILFALIAPWLFG